MKYQILRILLLHLHLQSLLVLLYHIHILTDNGLEFTDKFSCGKGFASGNHKFDVECKADEIEHRLTAPYTPQTNGMVERVNGTIKNATIKVEDYENIDDVKKDLNKFLIYYNFFNRRHGSLRKELKVRTLFCAVQSWFRKVSLKYLRFYQVSFKILLLGWYNVVKLDNLAVFLSYLYLV